MSLVVFHVKKNENFEGLRAETLAVDVLSAHNGTWSYEDHTTELQVGDTIHYWIHVVYENIGYNTSFQEHNVTGESVAPII